MAAAISSRNALRNTVNLPDNSNAENAQKSRPASAFEFLVSDKPAHEKTDLLADEMKRAMQALVEAETRPLPDTRQKSDLHAAKKELIKDESSATLIGFAIVIAAIFLVLNLVTFVI